MRETKTEKTREEDIDRGKRERGRERVFKVKIGKGGNRQNRTVVSVFIQKAEPYKISSIK